MPNVAFAAFASCIRARQSVYSEGVGSRLGARGGEKMKRNSGCAEKPAGMQTRRSFRVTSAGPCLRGACERVHVENHGQHCP